MSKGTNTAAAAADLESETMEISRAVSAIMAEGVSKYDYDGTSKSHAEDGTSCAGHADDDEISVYGSDDNSNQDDEEDEDEDESSRESDSDDDESEVESADRDNKPSSSRRLGRRGKSAEQSSGMAKSKSQSKKWGLKRLLGPKQRANTEAVALEGSDDDLSSSSPASASNMSAPTDAEGILDGHTTEDNTICTAGRVSIVEDVSTAAGNDGDEESTVAFEISTTFPDATSFIRSLGLGPKLLGYDSSNDDEEEEEDVIKNKAANALGVIEEDEAGDTHNAPTGTSPPLSITVSQSTDNDDRVGTISNANLNASIGIAPLTPSDRTASECRQPVGSPEKITVRREESDVSLGDFPTPKRMPFKSLVGRKPAKAPESPPKRKPRRDHVIVSVFSNDSVPSKPTTGTASSANPFGMCADASSEDAWYNCSGGALTAETNNDMAFVPTTKDDDAWTANFDEAFGIAELDDQKDSNIDGVNTKAEDVQPASSNGSIPSTGTDGPVLEQTTPSTPLNCKPKDLPPSPTSVITASDGKKTDMEAQKDEQDYVSEDLKKQVDELDQLISKMSYDMKLLSSIISEHERKEQRTTQPTSPEIGGSVRHRSLVDDIVDEIEEKGESKVIAAHAVDTGVEVPLDNSKFVTPSEDVGIDKPSVGPIVATESVPVTTTTTNGPGDFKTKHDELKKKQASKFLSKLFKGKKNTKSPPRSKNLSSPPRTKRSVLSFRRSNKPQASMGADDSNVVDAELSAADTAMLPVAEKSETFGDAILSTANALLDQAADYAFPPEEDDKAKLVEGKKGLKLKKKKKEKAKAKKSPSKLVKSKSKSQSMPRSSSKKKGTVFSKDENDRSERICRIFGDCADLYNDICNYQELSCMCQDFLCDAQDEATLAVCRVDYAMKKSIRNFGEQCIAVADGEEDGVKSHKSRRSKR